VLARFACSAPPTSPKAVLAPSALRAAGGGSQCAARDVRALTGRCTLATTELLI
jgi:hypothetical protein